MKLPTQLWLSDSGDPTEDLCAAITNSDDHWKPSGGLWTSTLDDGHSDWWRWCEGNEFGNYSSAWMLEPLDCRVYTVATPTDLHTFQTRYAKPEPEWMKEAELPSLRTGYLIDYERAAEDWDALWIPSPNTYRYSDPGAMWFSSMDAETTLWMRWMFESATVYECDSPFRCCDAWTYHVGDRMAECRLRAGHEGMHKSGVMETFEWSDSFSRHTPR